MEDHRKIGIIPYSTFRGWHISKVGSSFIRAQGLANIGQGFQIWRHGEEYESIIFQKAYWKEMMENFRGLKILDLCDPDWINGSANVVELGNMVHAITCSSEELTRVVKNFFPDKIVCHIPDRLNFNFFPEAREVHFETASTAVWFGYLHNAYETLPHILPALRANRISLKIITDAEIKHKSLFDGMEWSYVHYAAETAFDEIKEADFALNPKSPRAYFKFKSNNKNLISWRLGLPVAENIEDVKRLLSPEERNEEVRTKGLMVERDFNITQSALEYQQVFNEIRRLYFQ